MLKLVENEKQTAEFPPNIKAYFFNPTMSTKSQQDELDNFCYCHCSVKNPQGLKIGPNHKIIKLIRKEPFKV